MEQFGEPLVGVSGTLLPSAMELPDKRGPAFGKSLPQDRVHPLPYRAAYDLGLGAADFGRCALQALLQVRLETNALHFPIVSHRTSAASYSPTPARVLRTRAIGYGNSR